MEVEPEKRRYLSVKDRLDILIAKPHCAICGFKLGKLDEVDFDHRIPLALGGTNEKENFQGLHKNCHKEKTRQDVKAISKANRIRKKRLGLTKPKKSIPSRPFGTRKKQNDLPRHRQGIGEDEEGDA